MRQHLKITPPPQPTKLETTVFRPVDWQRLARANTHHLRVSILEAFGIDGGRTLSSSDLAYELQTPLANVNYHVTELAKHGLLVLSHRRRVRGATEHFYRLPGAAVQPEIGENGRSSGQMRTAERTAGAKPASTGLARVG